MEDITIIKGFIKDTKDYYASIDNLQWLHRDINWMKGVFDTERFIELCKMVALNN